MCFDTNTFSRYERHIVCPKLLSNLGEDYCEANAMFNSDHCKAGTARRFFCHSLNNKVNSYSFEVSFFGYKLRGSNVVVPYTEESCILCFFFKHVLRLLFIIYTQNYCIGCLGCVYMYIWRLC